MCLFRTPKMPAPPPPLPPAPPPPEAPRPIEELPDAQVRPVNPAVREAQSKLGVKKGKKGGTGDLRIKKKTATTSINTGATSSTPINKP